MKLQNLTHILIGIVCFGLLPGAQAVSPPPDGFYPNGNTAEGFQALQNLTTGAWNTALGHQTLHSNTTGGSNTATGVQALFNNTEGEHNTANGVQALFNNTTGTYNTANGENTLLENFAGVQNTAIGAEALRFNTSSDNTAVGFRALQQNRGANRNTAIGSGALDSNTTGTGNTAVGWLALLDNTTGSENIAIGESAGKDLTAGNNNIYIGESAGGARESNTIRIGFGAKRTFIDGISRTTVTGASVFVNGSGQLGIMSSSQRFKDDIKAMDKASEGLLALRPVTFRYNKEIDPEGIPQFGLVAEDVEKVNRDLVIHDKDGTPYSVRYDSVNAMLLNEFLKEHREVQELKKEVAALTAGLQKVSSQLEASKPAPQVVNNP